MREKFLNTRLRILYQRLDLINLYPDDFVEVLGEKGLEEYVNEALEEIKRHKSELQKIKSKDEEE